MSNAIVQQAAGALNAEHYQSFEMAKANDGILGGDDIAQIRSYAAYARAQAQAIHKTIAATSGIDDVAVIKAEATETAQTFAKVGIYADQRIGELLRELPTRQGKRTDTTSVRMETEVTKSEAIKNAGIAHQQAIDLQKMAANPEVVEAVIAKAEKEGRVVSRKQVLDAIDAKKRAERELADYRSDFEDMEDEAKQLKQQLSLAREEVAELERQNDALYAQKNPEPQVVEREVEVVREVESQESKRRIAELERDNERLNREYQEMWRKKRELDTKLDQANELLGEKGKTREAQRDIEYLTMQINKLLHQHGGKVWAFDQFYRVDEVTQQEFVKAITNLAAFSQNLMQFISDKNKLEA